MLRHQIPTKAPTSAPTETKTWIKPETEYKPPSCPSKFDRSSQGMYEMRGIGGGGAMSGLSISHTVCMQTTSAR